MSSVLRLRAVLPPVLLAAGLALPATSVAAPANLVSNGSFEQPAIEPGTHRHYDAIPGWERSAGSAIEVQHRKVGPPADGDQHVELDAKETGAPPAITQRVPTDPGTRYLLTFAFAARPGTKAGQNVMDVSWGGAALDQVDAGAGLPTSMNVEWRYHRYVVTATAATTDLTFAYAAPVEGYGGYLDDVRLEPVPTGTSVTGEVETYEDGWAAADGGTYGGALGGTTVIDDPDTAEQELRDALTDAAPRRVVLALPGVDGAPAVVKLSDEIKLASYKTVTAVEPVVITTKRTAYDPDEDEKKKNKKKDPEDRPPARCYKEQDSAFVLDHVEQVEISGIVFDGRHGNGCWAYDVEGADAIHVVASRHVWIHHNTFRRWSDGAIDITQGDDSRTSAYVTASWNRFERIFQAHLWQVEQASLHHNHCVLVGRRCPKSVTAEDEDIETGGGVARSFVHAYDNVVEQWDEDIVLAEAHGADAVLWAQQNAFLGSCSEVTAPRCPLAGDDAVPDNWTGGPVGTERNGGCVAMGGGNVFWGDARNGATDEACPEGLPEDLREASSIWNAPEQITAELVDVVRRDAGAPEASEAEAA